MAASDVDKEAAEIKPLASDAAFSRGIESFSELFLFYGVLITLCAYELHVATQNTKKQKAELAQSLETAKSNNELCGKILTELKENR